MRVLAAILFLASVPALAQERPTPKDIDPNTKIQGGADVRGSGAGAGAGVRAEEQGEPRPVETPPKPDIKEDRPTSARKPQEQEPRREEDAARGNTAKPQ